MKTIIAARNLAKAYAVYAKPSDFLREILSGRTHHDMFWALQGVSFEMCEKERVGIIGPNGSGKSTLLRLITGNLLPTGGSLEVNGRISAMLTLATALDPEETGLSNIRFNLLLAGCPKHALASATEEIVEFAELGPFIYAPVKTYSSGMNAKLAFAIATAIDPEILVIDEVLSVGDAYFMGKATQRMVDLCRRGKGLIFVSHSTSAIQMLCERVIWLENGLVRADGPAEYVLKLYEEDFRRKEDETTRKGNIARRSELAALPSMAEIGLDTAHRIRLVPSPARATFADTHYVRRIAVGLKGEAPQDLDLALPENANTHHLNVLGSEWGRLYARGPFECRLLAARTGKLKGGQIVVSVPPASGDVHVEVIVEGQSELGTETLSLEYLDLREGQWVAAETQPPVPVDSSWLLYRHAFTLRPASNLDRQTLVERIHAAERPDIEVREVTLYNGSGPTHLVREREPFRIEVQLTVNRETASADVGIRIMRRDGVYVFWQSSGLVGRNLGPVRADTVVTFDFSDNPIGQGEYLVSAYVANAWDFPANYPYSEVFDRKVNCAFFSVTNELPGLDFGVLNARVPVRVSADPC